MNPANRHTKATTIAQSAVAGSASGAKVARSMPERAADRRHDAEERRVHELPDRAHRDRREDERRDEHDPEERPPAPHVRDEHGEQQAEARLEDDRGGREHERVPEALVEDRVAEQRPRVVLETDERP